MKLSVWIHSHQRSILFFLALIAIAGVFSAFKLPVALFPNVDFPRVAVSLDAGDRPAEQMEMEVTMLAEEGIRRVPGVLNVRSTTSRGTADLSVNFAWKTDMALATSQVNQAIAALLPQLPAGTQFNVRRMDPTVFPILAYSLTSDNVAPTQLYDLAQYQLRPLLSGVNGVARIQVQGGAREEYQVKIDPAKLQAYDLSLSDVSKILAAANVVSAVGRLEDHYKLYLAISDTRLNNLDDIKNTVIKTGTNGLIMLKDVADIKLGEVPQWIRVNADGHDAVLLQIYQQPGSNSVQIAKDVKDKLDSYHAQLPKGIKIANWYDQSRLVIDSATSVRDAILIGVGLAALVLLVFLRNTRITLIAIVVVPTVLAATIVLLSVLNMSFNIMTMGGMAAAVGLIIDDAIVMIEHIVHRLDGTSSRKHLSVLDAAGDFLIPLFGSSAATIIIFIPLAFLDGVTGAFFKALSLTMAAGLLISFLVTWLAVPLLAERFLHRENTKEPLAGRLSSWIHQRYIWLMQRLLAKPLLILVFLLPLIAVGGLAYQKVGSGFMPVMDEGGFILDYHSAPGTSLTETDRLLKQVEKILIANPYVDTYARRTGTQMGGSLSESNEGDFFIRLKAYPRPAITTIMDDVRSQVEQQVPGLYIEMAQLMEDLIGDLTAVPQPIEIKIFADDTVLLHKLAIKTADAISNIKGVVEIRNGINPAGDALDIQVDRVKAALEGVDPDAVTRMLQDALSGQVTTQVRQGIKMVGVRVWIPATLRANENDIQQLLMRAPDGHSFPLKRVIRITPITGQAQINRENFKRMIAVTARISGRDLGSTIRDVKQLMNDPKMLPKGVYYELGGLYKEQQSAFKGLTIVFASAMALVFLLLLFLYERFTVAISIITMPLISLAAVFIGLWVAGIELNISAMMGMTMILGIVTEVGIFYFSAYQTLSTSLERTEALIQAGISRMRPIAMTTIAAILTLIPLAFAIGQGSAMQQPLAVAIVSGLFVQLPLVLFVMPVLFSILKQYSIHKKL